MTDKQFETLLTLSYLDVEEGEREGLKADVGSILEYVKQLQDIDLPDEMCAREVVSTSEYREDEVVAAQVEEYDLAKGSFPSTTDDGLVEAHGVLGHK